MPPLTSFSSRCDDSSSLPASPKIGKSFRSRFGLGLRSPPNHSGQGAFPVSSVHPYHRNCECVPGCLQSHNQVNCWDHLFCLEMMFSTSGRSFWQISQWLLSDFFHDLDLKCWFSLLIHTWAILSEDIDARKGPRKIILTSWEAFEINPQKFQESYN